MSSEVSIYRASRKPKPSEIITEFARGILESQEYRDRIIAQANVGTLDASIERLLYHYAYGKPRATVDVNVHDKRASSVDPRAIAARADRIRREALDPTAIEIPRADVRVLSEARRGQEED